MNGMERFAVIALPDGGERIIALHPIIRKLPRVWADILVRRMISRVTATVEDRQTGMELGYIIDMPGLFQDWESLSSGEQDKQLKGLVRCLKNLNVKLISFPYWASCLPKEAVQYLQDNELVLIDAFKIRTVSMMASFRHMAYIIKKELPWMKVGIWRADTDVGELWARILAPYFNEMTLGGDSREELFGLADALMCETGLSCQVACDMDDCFKNKHLVITTESWNYRPASGQLVFYNGILNQVYMDDMQGGHDSIRTESGWLDLPSDVKVSRRLQAWEVLGVLDGLLYIRNREYQSAASMDMIKASHIEVLQRIFGEYALNITGIMSRNNYISFDKFRMHYFSYIKESLNTKIIS